MCPFCIANATLVAGGAISASGVGALVGLRRGIREFFRKKFKVGK